MVKLAQIEPSPWRPLSEAQARKVRAVSAYLVSQLDLLTDWRLQKSYFLAEVWHIQEHLERLSPADFASWTFGPWSLHVREAVESLAADGTVEIVSKPAKRRPQTEFLKVARSPRSAELPSEEREFLSDVASQLQFLDGEILTRIAKAAPPYSFTRPGHRIDLDRFLSDLRDKHERLASSPKVAAMVAEAKAK